MRLTLTYISIFISLCLQAQTGANDSIKKSVDLDEIVVSANKTEEMKRQVASQISVINAKQIQFSHPQTSGDILANTGQILVQKSQQGGGSPVIRGFEASRVLLVIDGVRMNNLIYRSGHLQNIVTLDPSMLERVEIFFGPSSTIYGSDALGGTIHLITKKPFLDLTGKKTLSLNAMQRYSSVNNGLATNINFNLGFKKFASLTSLSYNKFGDLRMGKSKNIFYDTLYGLRKVYAQWVNGKDSAVMNNDPYIQTRSGYSQMDIMQKFLFKQSNSVEHQLNVQYSNSTIIPRYDRLTEISNGKPRFAEWYYGPQTRFLAAYDLNIRNKFGFNNIHIGVSRQTIQESRVNRNFDSSNLDTRIEDVGVIGYNIDFQKNFRKSKFRFGFDGQLNTLTSTAFRTNIETDEQTALDTRYPDGYNSLNHNALYLTHTFPLVNKIILNTGFRFGISSLRSDIKDNSFYKLPVTSVRQDNLTQSAYLGVIYNPFRSLKISYLTSSGYRVPNIDDLSKIFETTKGNVVLPNPDLEPERTLTNELGLSCKPIRSVKIETSFWHTFLDNAISVRPATLNGKDSVIYDGVMSKIFSSQNSDKAIIAGFSAGVVADITTRSQIYANMSFTRGILTAFEKEQPLDHITPVTANLGYIHTVKKLSAEGYLMFNGKKNIADYSPSGEDNQQYATLSGMPAWMTINLRLGYKLPKNLVLQGGIENILDTQYRVFASGISAPGRNFYIALRFSY